MDVATLRWFQQVADGTTVTEVSEIVGVTQSGVSRALARLEVEVGTPLLRRSGRTLRMTQAGSTFKRHVDRMLHELDDGLAALAGLASPERGTVSIAFELSLGTWLVPHLVATFHARYPDVQFDLHQTPDELASSPLLSGAVDLEITTVRPSGPAVRWRAVTIEPLRLVVARHHRLACDASTTLSTVADEPFVMLRPIYALRRISEELCQAAGFAPSIAFEGDDLSTVQGLVGAGLGVAIIPAPRRSGSADADLAVRYLTLDDAGASRQIGIAWSTERQLLPAAEQFRRHVLQEVRARVL